VGAAKGIKPPFYILHSEGHDGKLHQTTTPKWKDR